MQKTILTESILPVFLDRRLLDIGDDDEKLNHLQNAAEDVAANLRQHHESIIRYTVVALDPDIAADEPVLIEIEAAVKARWRTFANKFDARPRELLRAVALEALRLAAAGLPALPDAAQSVPQEPAIGAIIYLSGVSLLGYLAPGPNDDIRESFIRAFGEATEDIAVSWWSGEALASTLSLPIFQEKTELTTEEESESDVDTGALANHLIAAAGGEVEAEEDEDEEDVLETNPHTPTSDPAAWAAAFGPIAADGIAGAIDAANGIAIERLNEALKRIDTLLPPFAAALLSAVRQTAEQSAAGGMGYSRARAELLWWKETLYSPSLRVGYRSLDKVTAAVAIARDLHQQSPAYPAYHPQSVEFLLREVVREVCGDDASTTFTLTELVGGLRNGEDRTTQLVLRLLPPRSVPTTGRISLIDFFRTVVGGEATGDAATRVGVPTEVAVRLDELAVWLYRDAQALRLAGGTP